MKKEIEAFRKWAKSFPEQDRYGEWECDYEGWSEINVAFEDFINERNPESLSQEEIEDLIYIIARDNKIGELVDQICEKKEWFQSLLPRVVNSLEHDAQWQFAEQLSNGVLRVNEAEPALLKLVESSHEYTGRMALKALGGIGSMHAESLCEKAWKTNHEYQRIMALWVLKEIDSSKLPEYVELAYKDGRKYVAQNASEVENA